MEWYSEYQRYRKSVGLKITSNDTPRQFVKRSLADFPGTDVLIQEMVDKWYERRITENDRSYNTRANAINSFIRFIMNRGDGAYRLIEARSVNSCGEPGLFTNEQFNNLLKAVDELPTGDSCRSKYISCQQLHRALQLPCVVRLAYSSGMRPNEIRWLHREDVNLNDGTIQIKRSKGYHERIIAIHPSVISMLRKYDLMMDKYMPEREVFFPNMKGGYHNAYWIHQNFRACWDKYNSPGADGRKVVIYSLRHNYAVENINRMDQNGYNFDDRMLALSKSMGHRYVESTMYYYHLVPRFADLIEQYEGVSLDMIIPDIYDSDN